jgi:hypothetical protein
MVDPMPRPAFQRVLTGLALAAATAPAVADDARIVENEAAAVATLRAVAVAQAQFQASGAVDLDVDEVGEFGMFRELSGVSLRWSPDGTGYGPPLDPPLLPSEFATMTTWSEVRDGGYLFKMFLPGAAGSAVGETWGNYAFSGSVSSDLAETTWCCYAWPVRYGRTGLRTFFVNQAGRITSTELSTYTATGAFTPGSGGRAFRAGGWIGSVGDEQAVDAVGRDAQAWRTVVPRAAETFHRLYGTLQPAGSGSADVTFTIVSDQLRTSTWESIGVDGLPPRESYFACRIVLTEASGGRAAELRAWSGRDGAATFLPSRLPDEVVTLTPFAGGTIEVFEGDALLLRGVVPLAATPDGESRPDAEVRFRADAALTPSIESSRVRGTVELRVDNTSMGTRRRMRVRAVGGPRRATVVAIPVDGAEMRLGRLGPRGLLVLDTRRGDAVPPLATLAGARIEVRDRTGATVSTTTLPAAE